MKLILPLSVLAISVYMSDVMGQEASTNVPATPAGTAVVAPVVTQRDAPPANRETRVVEGTRSNSDSMPMRARRTGRATWAVDVQPAAILANIAADGFSVNGPNGKETLSLISSVPTVLVGADVACLDGYMNLRLGGGMLLNASAGTWLATGQVGYSLEVQRNVMFGPHVGLTYCAGPDWWGDTDITFKDSMGFVLGMHMAAGDRIAYLLSVDYMSMSFDVESMGPGVTANNSKLNMSGLAVQFGLRVQF